MSYSLFKPGQKVGHSGGIYQQVGRRGGRKRHFATIPDNRRLPPTAGAGYRWVLVRRTPNSKRRK